MTGEHLIEEGLMSAHEHHHEHDHHEHDHGQHGGLNAMAAAATLHCLTGCAIGEVLGLVIGTAAAISNSGTVLLSIALAFVFGYTLSTLPLLRSGLALGAALGLVVAADTLSIATMEVVDNLVMTVIPGAMNAGLTNPTFWIGMPISLVVAFAAAFPVNRYLLQRGRGHALTHEHHGAAAPVTGVRRLLPAIPPVALAVTIAAFIAGGLTVSIADRLS
ncbi:MAG TPA: DUF4396 domain-containing protein [Nocardioides sp.]|nr:DUF4396 domain-containing protein [Nocardioides sp.]